MNIYQAIWDEDMKGNGIRPTFSTELNDVSQGYVIVNSQSCHPESHIFKQVHIPPQKTQSYEMVRSLFDNYMLKQTHKEKNTKQESKEVEAFLTMAAQSGPVKLAKDFIEANINKKFSELEWSSFLHELWFRQFDFKNGKDLSAFEHVFVGERIGKKLVGHHFWYKFWLEENPNQNELHQVQIESVCHLNLEANPITPNVVTVGYNLHAYEYEKSRFIKLTKKKGAFFVGISAEGLLAMGTVRAILDKDIAVIDNVQYELELYMSPDGKSIRTFYPSVDHRLIKY